MRFFGTIDAKVDVKGRLFIPAVFRRLLQGDDAQRLFIRKDVFQDCLVLYPESVWHKRLDDISSRLNEWDPNEKELLRHFVADLEIVEIDSTGRILLPKRYLQIATITTDARFIGMDSVIEIWSKPKAEQAQLDPLEFGKQMQTLMSRPQVTNITPTPPKTND